MPSNTITLYNRYKYDKKRDFIARGQFGRVYKAENTEEKLIIALKEIDVDELVQMFNFNDEKDFIFRIAKEATILASLKHPNILKYFDSFYENEKFYIVSEFCDGKSLDDSIIIPQIKKNENEILKWLSQAVDALKYLHGKKIMHRDIKPRNIMLDKNEDIKFGDFGISTSSSVCLTFTIGTDGYRSPEIIAREEYTYSADIWALGATFYELCTHKQPFKSEADVTLNKPVNDLPNDYSRNLNKLIKKMILHDPENRIEVKEIQIYLENEFVSNKLPTSSPEHVQLIDELITNNIIRSDCVRFTMLAVDRGFFAPKDPYLNKPQIIGYGVTISAPHMHAHALEILKDNLKEGCKALDIGSGSGYLTACMALMVGKKGRVVGIDLIDDLIKQSHENIKKWYPEIIQNENIKLCVGDGRLGSFYEGPFNAIHVGAAAPEVPKALINQLAIGGRLVMPIGPQGETQNFTQFDKLPNGSIVKNELMSVIYGSLKDK